jgi:hypothetical protein
LIARGGGLYHASTLLPRWDAARSARTAALVAAGALLAIRLFHLSGPLDLPHAWRQAETAAYTRAFHEHGIDLFHPTVTWLGPGGVHAFEFPLAQAASALLYRAFGEDVLWDRLVALASFVGSAGFLFAIARRLSSPPTAAIATLVYLAMPLGQFFSRAAQVDFTAVFFSHAMLWALLRAASGEGRRWLVAGAAAAAAAFLVKAHYAFYLALPLAVFAAPRVPLRRAGPWLLAAAVPIALFLAWRHHAGVLNHSGPVFPHIPPGAPPTDTMSEWEFYLGTWAQRLDPAEWLHLARRVANEVFGWIGLALFAVGALARPAAGEHLGAMRAWLAGAVGFVLLFFNANLVHDYYQIPLLAPAALFVARGVVALAARAPRWRFAAAAALVVALSLENVAWAESSHYYVPCPLINGYGPAIGATTPPGSVVVIAGNDLAYSDPSMLYGARRQGWNVLTRKLTPALLSSLASHGATHLVLFGGPLPAETMPLLERLPRVNEITQDGQPIAWIFLLDGQPAVAATP